MIPGLERRKQEKGVVAEDGELRKTPQCYREVGSEGGVSKKLSVLLPIHPLSNQTKANLPLFSPLGTGSHSRCYPGQYLTAPIRKGREVAQMCLLKEPFSW